VRIPITMCHGVHEDVAGSSPALTRSHLDRLIGIAAEMGFQSVSYDDLAAWRSGALELPDRPIMIDFDHPMKSIRYECLGVLQTYGFRGNLFIDSGRIDQAHAGAQPSAPEGLVATWEEMGEIVEAGWQIGAHTVTHPNLSELSLDDPTGERIRTELEACDEAITRHLGVTPRDFAFTGTSWSSVAEREVKKRYRFGRLWIVGAEYSADGAAIRYADLVGVPGDDEGDGGPPYAARYITEDSDPYRLPSMELERLVLEPDAFRRYLDMALE
jgi:peptidoglycan/xylan/chitin deacetylase (PgdA/CDA1 family)